ncbi:MAG: tetratricopeptide repeat protein [Firmicutes bacterium]|nr:tetratricopeptide repeat protein [Bacillota bacterium]
MAVPELKKRRDPLKQYLGSEIKGLIFAELSEEFCIGAGLGFMIGVPVPFSPEDLAKTQSEGGVDISRLSDNMALVCGADPSFKYRDAYLEFLEKFFERGKLTQVLLSRAYERLEKRAYRRACVYSRAALLLAGEERDALFAYACCCREWYLSLEGDDEQELIAAVKAEANLYFEFTTDADEDFAPAWYYLGYAYLNQGSYKKAELAWERFLRLSADEAAGPGEGEGASAPGDAAGASGGASASARSEAVAEIRERLESLIDPVRIEEGIALLAAGRLEEGVTVLEPYQDTRFDGWWPLHYHLAQAYEQLGRPDLTIEQYERTAQLDPSNTEVYDALARLYAAAGDAEKADKYLNKIRLIRENK